MLNETVLNSISKNKSKFQFQHQYENCFVEDINKPEYAISFDEGFIRRLYYKYNLSIIEPIRFGSWCGLENYLSFQDTVVSFKAKF